MQQLVTQNKVLICVGSGGVGKTTVSASLGVLAAQLGLKVLVLTIDPARRLATSLGLDSNFEGEVRVPNQNYKGELYAALIHPEEIFETFIRQTLENEGDVERLLQNRLYRQLATTLSGSQEFTSLEKLLCSVESKKYDLVILDTPPAQHAVEFLGAPEKIYSLFQESVTRWFISPKGEGVGLFRKIVERGTKTVMGVLEKLTGSQFVNELGIFFECVWGLQKRIRERSTQVNQLLKESSTGFVLVTGFDESKLKEAQQFFTFLSSEGYRLVKVVLNRSFPIWAELEVDDDEKDQQSIKSLQELRQLYFEMKEYNKGKQKVYDQFVEQLQDPTLVVKIPEMNQDVVGIPGLELLAQEIHNRSRES
ncbi:MAG: ArsA family ATPase [Bdellovibrionales bacterium]|nr:ArsA family ATPase [Bdellovibrionales bacterium]